VKNQNIIPTNKRRVLTLICFITMICFCHGSALFLKPKFIMKISDSMIHKMLNAKGHRCFSSMILQLYAISVILLAAHHQLKHPPSIIASISFSETGVRFGCSEAFPPTVRFFDGEGCTENGIFLHCSQFRL